jgi:hypothetical protein
MRSYLTSRSLHSHPPGIPWPLQNLGRKYCNEALTSSHLSIRLLLILNSFPFFLFFFFFFSWLTEREEKGPKKRKKKHASTHLLHPFFHPTRENNNNNNNKTALLNFLSTNAKTEQEQ